MNEELDIYTGVRVLLQTGEILDVQELHYQDSRIYKIIADNKEQDLSTCKLIRTTKDCLAKPESTDKYNKIMKEQESYGLHFGYFDGMYIQGWFLMKDKGAVFIPAKDTQHMEELKQYLDSLSILYKTVYVNALQGYYIHPEDTK